VDKRNVFENKNTFVKNISLFQKSILLRETYFCIIVFQNITKLLHGAMDHHTPLHATI